MEMNFNFYVSLVILIASILGIIFSRMIAKALSVVKVRAINQKIADYEQKLQQKNAGKEAWTARPEPFNEDDIYNLKRDIQQLKKRIMALEQDIAETGDVSIQQIIKTLKRRTLDKEKRLSQMTADFAFYVSGIIIAKIKSNLKKKKAQKEALNTILTAWVQLFFVVGGLSAITSIVICYFWSSFVPLVVFFAVHSIIFATLLFKGYKEVPHQEEWVIEWFGKYLTIWESGLHFIFPFFMGIKQKVYMGDWSVTLYLDDEQRDGKQSAKMDFRDGSASMVVELFFRIFDAYRGVYEIDDLVSSVMEKMEAGQRAYFGKKKIDEAIETRSEVDLRQIITQPACEADIFKKWGVEIISTAVTDISLPKEIEEQRQKVLNAQKELEVSEIDKKTEVNKADIEKTKGKGVGAGLKELAEGAGITPSEAVAYSVQNKRYSAAEKAKTLIMTDSNNTATDGVIAGTAAAAGVAASSIPTN